MTQLYQIKNADGPRFYDSINQGLLVPIELLGVGEFAERVGLKKSTIYVYHSTGRLPKPDLVVNGGNTALWLDSTVDRWNEER